MPDTPHSKAFQRAVEVFGSVKALSHWLKVPSDTITTWISGEAVPPRAIFLQVANFVESAEKEVAPPQSSPASGNSPGIGLGMRILVAHDDRDTLMTLGILLRSEGFDVQLLQRGGDVPGAMRTFRPHAVLLDLAMPGRSGYEVATEITQTYGNARPVLIAVRGQTSELDKQAAELCGFDHLVSKPYDADSLLALLASLKATDDDQRVNADDPSDIARWAELLCTTPEELRKAIEAVGPRISDLKRYLFVALVRRHPNDKRS